MTKTYSLSELKSIVRDNFTAITAADTTGIDPQAKQRAKIVKEQITASTSGDGESRNIVKNQINTMISSHLNIYHQKEIIGEFRITNENIDNCFDFGSKPSYSNSEKLLFVLMFFNRSFGYPEQRDYGNVFSSIVQEIGIENFKKVRSTDYYDAIRYEFDLSNLNFLFNLCHDKMIGMDKITFEDKKDYLVQMIYQENYGLFDVDLLAYMDINEVIISQDGNFISVWDNYKFHLSFLKLSKNELSMCQERATSSLADFSKSSPISVSNPYVTGHRADHARVTASQPPFSTMRNLHIRLFNKDSETVETLLKSPLMISLVVAAIKSGMSIIFQGGLGVGKTTLMKAVFEIIDDHLHVGMVEGAFEQFLTAKYDDKRIVELQVTESKTIHDCVQSLLRMSVDIADLGEALSGDEVRAFIDLRRAVSISAFLTAQVVSPKETVNRLKNMLMSTGVYNTEASAVTDIVNSINLIFQHGIVDGKRVITEVAELIPTPVYDKSIEALDTISSKQLMNLYLKNEILKNPQNLYHINTLIRYENGEYRVVGNPKLMSKFAEAANATQYLERYMSLAQEGVVSE